MGVKTARDVGPSRIEIAYEDLGPAGAPPVLLIMGLGSQMLGWPDGFCAEREVRERAGLAYDRSYDPAGLVRQAVASLASGDRTAGLRTIAVPTPVIHGAADKMCDVSGGRATAEAVGGAELVVIEGMGHSLPRPLWPRITRLIADLVRRAEAGGYPAPRR